jgi:hypothetical protein
MRALYRRLRAQPMTDNAIIAIVAVAAATVLAIDLLIGLPQ